MRPLLSKARLLRIAVVAAVLAALLVFAAALIVRFGPAQWDEQKPTAAGLRAHWQASVRWMREHQDLALADGNPMLWRMVSNAAKLSGDPDLAELVRQHRTRYFTREPVDAWVLLLDPDAQPRSTVPHRLEELPGYMKLFAYGMTCDVALGASDAVQHEMRLDLCRDNAARRALRDSKCVSHQLVGFMLAQQRGCGDAAMTKQLQDRIVDELSIDFVVRDAHLQRALVLYWTGAPERVKPVWLNRMLRAQRADGGWDYDSQYSRWISPESEFAAANFHATAQALLVIAMAMPLTEAVPTQRR